MDERHENTFPFVPYKLDLVMLECIEQGKPQWLKEWLNQEMIDYQQSVLPQKYRWNEAMCFMSGVCYAFAVKGGLSAERASAISKLYTDIDFSAYSKEQFAYLYKCLGCYYEIKENIDIATVCYLTSFFYKYDEENEKTVIELAKFYGKIDLNSNEDVKHIFDKYNIQHGVSKEVLFALDDFIKYTKKINDIGTCKYLLNIMIELTNKEHYKTELEKLLID